MTFGIGSPGFDPFYCPPCPPETICYTICLDPIDGPIVLLVATAIIALTVRAFDAPEDDQ